jgi:hypothetical protein
MERMKGERTFSEEESGLSFLVASGLVTRDYVLVFLIYSGRLALRALRNLDWFGFASLRETVLEDERNEVP